MTVDREEGPAGRRVFFVQLPDRHVVLKVHNVPKPRSVGCDFAVEAMSRNGVPTPRVLAVERRPGDLFDAPFLILERANGMPMDRWLLEHKPQPVCRDAVLRRVGEHLRKIHSVRVPSGWGNVNDQGAGKFGGWREYIEKHVVRQADGRMVRALDATWLEEEALISRSTRARLGAIGERLGLDGPSEASLVHNDLTLKHIFIDPAELRVTAILDLHNALAGDPALDLARFEYFYRGRGYSAPLRAGHGEVGAGFERRCLHLLIFVLLEKLAWLRGREERFPGRLQKDLALLEQTVEALG